MEISFLSKKKRPGKRERNPLVSWPPVFLVSSVSATITTIFYSVNIFILYLPIL
jgi:hypothetical protein